MAKRKAASQDETDATSVKKMRLDPASAASSPSATPSKRKSILRGTPGRTHALQASDTEDTPATLRRVLFSTPAANGNDESRKRSVPNESRTETDITDNAQDDDLPETPSAPNTPSKRGRPKGRRRERTPSPPPELPPHELFFFHHRAGGAKTSANTLPAHLLLNHEDFFAQMTKYVDPHAEDMEALGDLHRRAFDQWSFELAEKFNICVYGYGSKRALLTDFAAYLYQQNNKIVVINGYAPGLAIRDILSSIAGVILPKGAKISLNPTTALDTLLAQLDHESRLVLVVHSLDHVNLRRPATQSILARLANHSAVSVVASCDTPNFPLLWDASQQRLFRWLYHDTTTFAPYTAELEVVEDVNSLLGRSTRRLGGKDGVAYVLRSLPDNARTLFRILVAEQLALGIDAALLGEDFDADSVLGVDDEEAAAATPRKGGPRRLKATAASTPEGVEYRTLYHKAIEEFVCSSEVGFRTLLKEFHDHQMIESRKDGMGTERLVVPFRKDELEQVLEELV